MQKSVGEPNQGCESNLANGGNLRGKTYDNSVPSLEIGRCND